MASDGGGGSEWRRFASNGCYKWYTLMLKVSTARGFDRPLSGADFDAHTVPVAAGVIQKVDEVNYAQQASDVSDGQTKESCWSVSSWIAVEWRSIMATTGVDKWLQMATLRGVGWHRMVSNGGGWRRKTQVGSDAENSSGILAESYDQYSRFD